MAISLNSEGLSLNYPTSIQTSAVSVPVGGVAIYQVKPESPFSLSGTWAWFTNSGYSGISSEIYHTISGDSSKFLAIRVA